MTTFTQAPTTTYTLQVFHNTYSDAEGRGAFSFAPFDPTHPIVHVADLTVEANSIEGAMNRAYHLLNVGDDPEFGTPEPQAVAYRARRNRSLSVHDVLVFDGVAFAVADCCFARVTIDPAAVSTTSVYGSTYLP